MSIPDRHYQDKPVDELMKEHEFLYVSLSSNMYGPDLVARDKLNILLEYARELTIREVLGE